MQTLARIAVIILASPIVALILALDALIRFVGIIWQALHHTPAKPSAPIAHTLESAGHGPIMPACKRPTHDASQTIN
jgi:hypothetical protein